ncbi:cytochrome c oxidase subunit 6B1-like isoform X2 [Cimex lectularius]|uniref:Uncharacterized protein n=1 Tax=Cimex lectularius TaxID=79782 RepID=A0A8I6SFR2_CIMLE|nr:cytochrome c oxidase subunit 6B1-like isoform X2 [Cimex lectularius]
MTEVDIDGMLCEPKIKQHQEAEEQGGICPPDSRFLHQNKPKWCYAMFEDYERCLKHNSNKKTCQYFFSIYNQYCPKAWVEQWEEQVEKGIFPRDLTKEMGREFQLRGYMNPQGAGVFGKTTIYSVQFNRVPPHRPDKNSTIFNTLRCTHGVFR